eukprot:1502400-Prymnesium_polylepis.1
MCPSAVPDNMRHEGVWPSCRCVCVVTPHARSHVRIEIPHCRNSASRTSHTVSVDKFTKDIAAEDVKQQLWHQRQWAWRAKVVAVTRRALHVCVRTKEKRREIEHANKIRRPGRRFPDAAGKLVERVERGPV